MIWSIYRAPVGAYYSIRTGEERYRRAASLHAPRPQNIMRLTGLFSLIGIVLLSTPATAQDPGLEPPPELFQGTTDSTQIHRSYAAGFMDASTVMLRRPPGHQIRLWRQQSTFAPEELFVPELMWRHFGIRLEMVDSDTLTAAELAHYAGYNTAVEETLKREHGIDVFEKIAEEARVQYRLYRERSFPPDR